MMRHLQEQNQQDFDRALVARAHCPFLGLNLRVYRAGGRQAAFLIRSYIPSCENGQYISCLPVPRENRQYRRSRASGLRSPDESMLHAVLRGSELWQQSCDAKELPPRAVSQLLCCITWKWAVELRCERGTRTDGGRWGCVTQSFRLYDKGLVLPKTRANFIAVVHDHSDIKRFHIAVANTV